MCAKFLIVGGGNLGSRHLQGILQLENPVSVDVLDTQKRAIDLCKIRAQEILECSPTPHKIEYHSSHETLSADYDLGINATSSTGRLASLRLTTNRARFWILEKILTQNSEDLSELLNLTSRCDGVWVNYMMRELNWLQNLKNELANETVEEIELDGLNWSIACNLTHHLDFASWLGECALVSLDTNKLGSDWYESKRPNFYETLGEVTATFSNGMSARYASRRNGPPRLTKIRTSRETWAMDEINATVMRDNKVVFSGTFERQSQLTTKLANNILNNKTCNLPMIEEASKNHKIFIDAFLKHWQKTMDRDAKRIPIT